MPNENKENTLHEFWIDQISLFLSTVMKVTFWRGNQVPIADEYNKKRATIMVRPLAGPLNTRYAEWNETQRA